LPRVSGSFRIQNKLGMHARAAAAFVKAALPFEAEVEIRKGDVSANGKSIMSVLQLAAAKGDMVVITAEGPDCQQAVAALGALINDFFGEGG
jgi:phosphocarrier protein HPr